MNSSIGGFKTTVPKEQKPKSLQKDVGARGLMQDRLIAGIACAQAYTSISPFTVGAVVKPPIRAMNIHLRYTRRGTQKGHRAAMRERSHLLHRQLRGAPERNLAAAISTWLPTD